MAQGFVGQTGRGVVTLLDAEGDPGATYDTIAYTSGDPAVASVVADTADALQCTVTLLAPGATTITCNVDARQGADVVPLVFAVDVDAQTPPPGEAEGGTFELGAFTQISTG